MCRTIWASSDGLLTWNLITWRDLLPKAQPGRKTDRKAKCQLLCQPDRKLPFLSEENGSRESKATISPDFFILCLVYLPLHQANPEWWISWRKKGNLIELLGVLCMCVSWRRNSGWESWRSKRKKWLCKSISCCNGLCWPIFRSRVA